MPCNSFGLKYPQNLPRNYIIWRCFPNGSSLRFADTEKNHTFNLPSFKLLSNFCQYRKYRRTVVAVGLYLRNFIFVLSAYCAINIMLCGEILPLGRIIALYCPAKRFIYRNLCV